MIRLSTLFFLIFVLPLTLLMSLTPSRALGAERNLSLQQFLELVRAESPDLKAEKAKVEAADAMATGVRLMPPMVGLMQMKEGGETVTGYEISQELPFPTKITGDKKARERESEAMREMSRGQIDSVLSTARQAYVAYWMAYEKKKIAVEKRTYLLAHMKLVRAATRSDVEGQLHSLEVESITDLSESELLQADAELREMRSDLAMYAPSLAVVKTAAADELVPEEPGLEALSAAGASHGPMVVAKEKEVLAKEAKEGLAGLGYAPDFFLRFRSFEASMMEPSNQELMVGLSLPFVFSGMPRAEKAASTAERMRAEAELLKARVEAEAKAEALVAKAEALKGQISVLRTKLIPRAQRRTRLIKALSQRGLEGLDEQRMVTLDYLELRMKAVELLSQYENLASEMLKIKGHTPTAVGAP